MTVFEAAEDILRREDDDVSAAVKAILTEEGITLVTGTQVLEVDDGPAATTIVYEQDGTKHSTDVDAVLVAAGRRPVVDDLNLEAAGVRVSPEARSRSTSTSAPAGRTSSPSATSTAARSSRTSPSTTAG